MDICSFIVIGYFVVGVILAYVWWNDEYKVDYEVAKDVGEVENSMAVLLLAGLTIFWPFKLLKNYFESFVD